MASAPRSDSAKQTGPRLLAFVGAAAVVAAVLAARSCGPDAQTPRRPAPVDALEAAEPDEQRAVEDGEPDAAAVVSAPQRHATTAVGEPSRGRAQRATGDSAGAVSPPRPGASGTHEPPGRAAGAPAPDPASEARDAGGTLTPREAILDVFGDELNRTALRTCYEEILEARADAAGQLTFAFTINAPGNEGAAVLTSIATEQGFELEELGCFADAFATFDFGDVDQPNLQVNYPVRLSPSP